MKSKKKTEPKIAMLAPSGQRWFTSYADALAAIREDYPTAVKIHRWHENHLNYEDFRDASGDVVAQLEMSPGNIYPPMVDGFIYE
jgi:hypothetical protein